MVKTLESEGIGRPSTYASIIETLKKRDYVKIENKAFVPTDIGYEVKIIYKNTFLKLWILNLLCNNGRETWWYKWGKSWMGKTFTKIL